MHEYRSLTTQRLLAVDARLEAMARTREIVGRRLSGELRALNVVLGVWAATMVGVLVWIRLPE